MSIASVACLSIASSPQDEPLLISPLVFHPYASLQRVCEKLNFCPYPRTNSNVHLFYNLDISFGKHLLFLCSWHSNLVCTLCIYFGCSYLHGKDLILLVFSLMIFLLIQQHGFSNLLFSAFLYVFATCPQGVASTKMTV